MDNQHPETSTGRTATGPEDRVCEHLGPCGTHPEDRPSCGAYKGRGNRSPLIAIAASWRASIFRVPCAH